MLPQYSAPSSGDRTPVLKHATSNLLGSTTVTPVPSRQPSPVLPPPSVTPNSSSSGTNVSTSLPQAPSAPAVQHGPPQPSSLPECTTKPQQDTRPPPARGPNSEIVFSDRSRPSLATADSASPFTTLSSPYSATSSPKSANGSSPSSAANGTFLSKPLPATNNMEVRTNKKPISIVLLLHKTILSLIKTASNGPYEHIVNVTSWSLSSSTNHSQSFFVLYVYTSFIDIIFLAKI